MMCKLKAKRKKPTFASNCYVLNEVQNYYSPLPRIALQSK